MFGGLLASAIAKMDGIRGYSSWRWVFILEGLLTMALSVVAFIWIPDFPEDVHWLSKEETQFVAARVGIDHGAKSVRVADVLLFFADIKNLLRGLMYFGMLMSSDSLHILFANPSPLATVVPIYCERCQFFQSLPMSMVLTSSIPAQRSPTSLQPL